MDIDALTQTIQTLQPPEFSVWIESHERELSNFFYKCSSEELDELDFNNRFFGSIATSASYKRYLEDRNANPFFGRLMEMMAVSAEKLAIIGIDAMLETLISDLESGAHKLRLEALMEFALVENIEKDYFTKLPKVLSILEASQDLDEGGNIRLSIDIILHYIFKARKAFSDRGMNHHLAHLIKICTDAQFLEDHPMMAHPVITAALAGEDAFALRPVDVIRDRLESSEYFKDIVSIVNKIYYDHPQIDHFARKWWKYDNRTIREQVLKNGRTDFREPYDEISPEEKVILYCFFNMKKHFFTSYAVFERILPSLQAVFNQEGYEPIMIDLGCGPMTSGIAIADLMMATTGIPLTFTYVGVDIAPAMIAKAKTFESSALFANSKFYYWLDWDEIDFSVLYAVAGQHNPVVFNASYMFASDSLDVEALANLVSEVVKLWDRVFLIFQNPDSDNRNVKYVEFKSLLQHEEILDGVETIRYKTGSSESSERVYYQILKFNKP